MKIPQDLKRTGAICMSVLVALAIYGCAPSAATQEATAPPQQAAAPTQQAVAPTQPMEPETGELWFANIGDLTGPAAEIGRYAECGVELAVEEINAAGGINGKTLMVDQEDDRLDPKEAASIAQKLVGEPRMLAQLGYTSSTGGLAAVPISNAAGLLQLSWGNTSPKLSGNSAFYRLPPTDAVFGRQVGHYAVEEMGKKQIAIMVTQSDGPIANADAFRLGAEEAGATIVAYELHQDTTKDYTPTLTKIKALNPDLIYTSTWYSNGALIATQARSMGITADFMGMDATYNPGLITLGGAAVEGYWAAGFFHPDQSTEAKEFAAAYATKCGFEPESFGATAYDGTYLIADAMRNGGETREAVLEYMSTVTPDHPFQGVTGTIAFDSQHDPSRSAVVARIEGGKWVFKAVISPPE
jgi:branched-chain amino acid transport system substrate-binding protein